MCWELGESVGLGMQQKESRGSTGFLMLTLVHPLGDFHELFLFPDDCDSLYSVAWVRNGI